ncbi:hypothetical protein [Galactobacter valiniphilus]|uniref:hypothetical protein n=1 Tax=Galactobacter valiniphilus TaxID=2676122 RepID=UPI003737060F
MTHTPTAPAQHYLDVPGQPRRVRITCPRCNYPHTYAAPRYRTSNTATQVCGITGQLITITGLERTA